MVEQYGKGDQNDSTIKFSTETIKSLYLKIVIHLLEQ